jgi:hypothetical protein
MVAGGANGVLLKTLQAYSYPLLAVRVSCKSPYRGPRQERET